MNSPIKPIALIGMWLVFGPMAAAGIGILIDLIYSVFTRPFGPVDFLSVFRVVVGLGMFFGLSAIPSVVVFKTTRNYILLKMLPPLKSND